MARNVNFSNISKSPKLFLWISCKEYEPSAGAVKWPLKVQKNVFQAFYDSSEQEKKNDKKIAKKYIFGIIVQRKISDPTVYDMSIFGDCVCFTVCVFVTFGHFGPFRGQKWPKSADIRQNIHFQAMFLLE